MKLVYSNDRDESAFVLTDFNCASSLELLKHQGLYKIVWCIDHPITIKIDGYFLELDVDQVAFCTPVNVLEIANNTSGIISFVFNREFYCIRDHDEEVSCNGFLFFGSSYLPVILLSDKHKKSFAAMLHLFTEEFKIKDQIQGEMLRTLLKRMLILSRRLLKDGIVQPNMPDTQLNLISRYNVLVEKFFREKHAVSDYSQMLNKSPKTLTNYFGKYNNQTPLQVINRRILMEAKRLFLFSDKTSQQIAYELGFKEAGHFSKFFKKNEGCSPTEFKKKKLVPPFL